MAETTLQDPFFTAETQGYRRDLAASMIIQCYENRVRGGIDKDYSENTRYLLSQLDKEELTDAIIVAERDIG